MVVASELLDDSPGWHEIAPSTFIRVGRGAVEFEPLRLIGARRKRRST
jgi:hypothetical protein